MKSLLPANTLAALPPGRAATITGTRFFPNLISGPFMHGLRYAFTLSLVIFLIAAVASWLRGPQTVEDHDPVGTQEERDWAMEEADRDYVHHVVDDLAGFLAAAAALQGPDRIKPR